MVVVGEDKYLYATGEKVNKYGIFYLIMLDNNKVKIKQKDGDYIKLDNKNFLIANSSKSDATKFTLYKVDNKEYAIKAPNGYYVRVRDDDLKLAAKAEDIGKKTRFKFKAVD
ncbi:hypothetical protein [Romboutsia sp.]|uniref:fascin domain-containing protein n=1 Tax=Romboutsia sp. TaxID=1965302 RepID=UPI002C60FC28|nr:hypothetical protein [Romboutsia sp.]HSQ87745.1 hypothetical protein [Romboutsia sp.]